MALFVDQQSKFKYFCKICKKGFLCGRALGGHMRAHGIGDESVSIDNDDQASDWEDKLGRGGGGSTPPSNKSMYALRTNPNRPRYCRVCENCGKEFLSWKSFLEHGKCSLEDARSLMSSLGSDGEDDVARRNYNAGGSGSWSKRRRSYRTKVGNCSFNCPSSEEEDLANCLIMLSNATVDPAGKVADQPEESCASACRDEERRNPLINFIAPVAARAPIDKAKGAAKGMFECKSCKKVFNSHQALGGHRASHKKVKGCFAAKLDHLEDSLGDNQDYLAHLSSKQTSSPQLDHVMSKSKSKVHECSICHRVFLSGQALGGHKRCHWITSNSLDTSTSTRFQSHHDHMEQVQERPMYTQSDQALDLNLPAPNDDLLRIRRDSINQLTLQVSTDFFLHSWGGTIETEINGEHHDYSRHYNHQDEENEDDNNNKEKKKKSSYRHDSMLNKSKRIDSNVDDEADGKVKLSKLSELKDENINGSSSPWLQVGIGTSNGAGTDLN